MKLFYRLTIVLATVSISAILISGCQQSSPNVDLPAAIADKAAAFGNPESNIVIVNTQGGPRPELATDELLSTFGGVSLDDKLLVNVHQAQTLAPENFTTRAITFAEAKAADDQSVAMLRDVVRHYKDEGKRVYVVGISFGAFMTQELLAFQGNVADGYLIVVGRLDMPAAVWEEFAEGRMVGFENGVDIVQFSADDAGMGGEGEFTDANMARIAAGLGHKRYTALLAATNLSNVVYAYGKVDEQVGRLSDAEVAFLAERGVTVLAGDGDHGGTIDEFVTAGVEQLLKAKAE